MNRTTSWSAEILKQYLDQTNRY